MINNTLKNQGNISKFEIEKNLKTSYIGKKINIAYEVDSTNDWTKREVRNNFINGSVFLSETQSNGRGRLGNNWECQEGKDILMSVAVDFGNKTIKSFMPLVVGLAVSKAINLHFKCKATLKWPNDILIENRKVCGILCESIKGENNNVLIIGIGINCNSENFYDSIKNTATSLYLATKNKVKRETLISEILNNLELYLNAETDEIIGEYRKNCVSIGKTAEVNYGGNHIEGIMVDIANNGELLIKCKDNTVLRLNSLDKIRQKL